MARSICTMAVFLLFVLVPLAVANKSKFEYKKIAHYQPLTDVRDHAVIDLDVQLFKTLLLKEDDLAAAKRVYQVGAFSRAYAELSLGFEGLPGDIDGHTTVTGTSESGATITGISLDNSKLGSKTIRVEYNNLDNPVPCYVGGHPEPNTAGCFAAAGQLSFDTMSGVVPYSYNIMHQNHNDRVLAWMSTHAEQKMKPCGNCDLYDEYFRYFTWYGKHDYAHRWVMAALTGAREVFDASAVDFSNFSLETRAAGAEMSIVLLSLFPYVIREMEVAVHECRKLCKDDSCQDTATRLADSAYAFYAGSLEDGTGSGQLLYRVAEHECQAFRTCGTNGDATHGVSKVNQMITSYFTGLQANITTDDCWDAHAKKDLIIRQMIIPLVQGTIRHAYKIARKENSPKDTAIGAAFAAAIVPLVAGCSFTDAEIIDNNMELTSRGTDFALVKKTLEKHYACLGISCHEVGGLWDASAHAYFAGAEPCHNDDVKEEKPKSSRGRFLGLVIGLPLSFVLVVLVLLKRLQRQARLRRKKERMEHPDEFSDSEGDDDDKNGKEARFV